MLHFLRTYPSALDDISSFILDLERCRIEPFTKQATPMSIRAGLGILMRGLSPHIWRPLVDTAGYKGESWMR